MYLVICNNVWTLGVLSSAEYVNNLSPSTFTVVSHLRYKRFNSSLCVECDANTGAVITTITYTAVTYSNRDRVLTCVFPLLFPPGCMTCHPVSWWNTGTWLMPSSRKQSKTHPYFNWYCGWYLPSWYFCSDLGKKVLVHCKMGISRSAATVRQHWTCSSWVVMAAFRISYQGGQNNRSVISGGAKYVLKGGGHNV